MTDSEPDSCNSSFQHNYFNFKQIHCLSFLLIFTLLSFKVHAQQEIDSVKTQYFYEDIIRQTRCGGKGLSIKEFQLLLSLYFKRTSNRNNYPSYYSNRDNEDPYSYQSEHSSEKQSSHTDTFVRVVYIHDTIIQAAAPDTVFIGSALPSSDEVLMSQEILKKIIKDKEFANLIRGTISEMSADELEKFKKDMNKEFGQVKSELALEQARRRIAELEAKKEERLARQEKQQEQREKWKVLSKEERVELIKARATVLAYGTAAAAGAAGAAVVGVGAIVGAGIFAIGKGLIRVPVEIWNWLDHHFYVKIDMSCAAQQQLRAYRMSHHHKPKPIKKYSGHCPGW